VSFGESVEVSNPRFEGRGVLVEVPKLKVVKSSCGELVCSNRRQEPGTFEMRFLQEYLQFIALPLGRGQRADADDGHR
jgi:hypothetical protein